MYTYFTLLHYLIMCIVAVCVARSIFNFRSWQSCNWPAVMLCSIKILQVYIRTTCICACNVRYRPEVTSHSLETFSLLLARVPLELAIYQVESLSFWLKSGSTLSDVCEPSKAGYFHWKLLVTTRCYIVNTYQHLDSCFSSAAQTSCLPLFQSR